MTPKRKGDGFLSVVEERETDRNKVQHPIGPRGPLAAWMQNPKLLPKAPPGRLGTSVPKSEG